MLKDLEFDLKIANILDQHGLYSFADEIEKNLKPKGKILILVHPDAIFEKYRISNFSFDKESHIQKMNNIYSYMSKLQDAITIFNKIFTLFMMSDSYDPFYLFRDPPEEIKRPLEEQIEAYKKFRNFLNSNTTAVHDNMSMGANAFNNLIGPYLIDNPSEVYMSGGYEGLCLKDAEDNFCRLLSDLLGVQPKTYNDLVFTRAS